MPRASGKGGRLKIFLPKGEPAEEYRKLETESVVPKRQPLVRLSVGVGMGRAMLLAAFAVYSRLQLRRYPS